MLRRSFRASSHWNVCFTCIKMMMMMMMMLNVDNLLTLISQRKWIPLLEMKACRPFWVLTIAIITCNNNIAPAKWTLSQLAGWNFLTFKKWMCSKLPFQFDFYAREGPNLGLETNLKCRNKWKIYCSAESLLCSIASIYDCEKAVFIVCIIIIIIICIRDRWELITPKNFQHHIYFYALFNLKAMLHLIGNQVLYDPVLVIFLVV